MKLHFRFFVVGISCFIFSNSFSQTLPVGTPLFEEMLRRKQIHSGLDINTSFTIRPIYSGNNLPFDSIYNLSDYLNDNNAKQKKLNKGLVRLLPVTINQQYNSHHPYGWNDGAMIPARGYEA